MGSGRLISIGVGAAATIAAAALGVPDARVTILGWFQPAPDVPPSLKIREATFRQREERSYDSIIVEITISKDGTDALKDCFAEYRDGEVQVSGLDPRVIGMEQYAPIYRVLIDEGKGDHKIWFRFFIPNYQEDKAGEIQLTCGKIITDWMPIT